MRHFTFGRESILPSSYAIWKEFLGNLRIEEEQEMKREGKIFVISSEDRFDVLYIESHCNFRRNNRTKGGFYFTNRNETSNKHCFNLHSTVQRQRNNALICETKYQA